MQSRRDVLSAAMSALTLPAAQLARAMGPRTSDLRRAVEAYVRTYREADDVEVNDDDDLEVFEAAAGCYEEAKEHAIGVVMDALGDVDYPAALDLGDCIVVIGYDPDDEFKTTDEARGQAVIIVLAKDRIVRA